MDPYIQHLFERHYARPIKTLRNSIQPYVTLSVIMSDINKLLKIMTDEKTESVRLIKLLNIAYYCNKKDVAFNANWDIILNKDTTFTKENSRLTFYASIVHGNVLQFLRTRKFMNSDIFSEAACLMLDDKDLNRYLMQTKSIPTNFFKYRRDITLYKFWKYYKTMKIGPESYKYMTRDQIISLKTKNIPAIATRKDFIHIFKIIRPVFTEDDLFQLYDRVLECLRYGFIEKKDFPMSSWSRMPEEIQRYIMYSK